MRISNFKYSIVFCILVSCFAAKAQVVIGDPKNPESFSSLEIASNTKGIRIPQLNFAQRTALTEILKTKTAEGLIIYNITDHVVQYWNGTNWVDLSKKGGSLTSTDLRIVGGSGATLSDVVVSIAPKSITLDKMQPATDKINYDKIYATNSLTGDVELIDKVPLSPAIELANGLDSPSDLMQLGIKDIGLGGALSEPTVIGMGVNNFNIVSSSANFKVDDSTLVVAQKKIGVNRDKPFAELDINGAISTNEEKIEIVSKTVMIPNNVGQVMLSSATENFSINLPADAVAGQRLILYNNTNYIGEIESTLNPHAIFPRQAMEFFFHNGFWRNDSPNTTITQNYVTQVLIPPFTDPDWTGGNPKYDLNGWSVFSKESFASESTQPPKSILVYEYTGTPFDLNNLYVMLTPGNDHSSSESFDATVLKVENEEKTRVTVVVVRTDEFGSGNENWTQVFQLNIMLINSTNRF